MREEFRLKQPGSIIETKREESREKRIGKKETRSIAGLEVYNGFRADDTSHRIKRKDFGCSILELILSKRG